MVEGNITIVTYATSWNQTWTGITQKRQFEIVGNKLTVTSEPTKDRAGQDIVFVVTYERVEWGAHQTLCRSSTDTTQQGRRFRCRRETGSFLAGALRHCRCAIFFCTELRTREAVRRLLEGQLLGHSRQFDDVRVTSPFPR
jgi:hypothetical protein